MAEDISDTIYSDTIYNTLKKSIDNDKIDAISYWRKRVYIHIILVLIFMVVAALLANIGLMVVGLIIAAVFLLTIFFPIMNMINIQKSFELKELNIPPSIYGIVPSKKTLVATELYVEDPELKDFLNDIINNDKVCTFETLTNILNKEQNYIEHEEMKDEITISS